MQLGKDQNHPGTARPIQKIASFVSAAGMLWLLGAAPAQAASVSYFLDQSNHLPDGTNYMKVSIDDESQAGAINFHIQTLETLADLACDKFGILKFGFNGEEIGKDNILGLPDGWKIKHDKKMDGFGKFENVLIVKKRDIVDSLSFSIIGIDGDSINSYTGSHDGGDGVFFSAFVGGIERYKYFEHKKWYGKWHANHCHRCSKGDYIGGGELAPVPVPGALWLFGSGLVGVFGLGSRRRMKAT